MRRRRWWSRKSMKVSEGKTRNDGWRMIIYIVSIILSKPGLFSKHSIQIVCYIRLSVSIDAPGTIVVLTTLIHNCGAHRQILCLALVHSLLDGHPLTKRKGCQWVSIPGWSCEKRDTRHILRTLSILSDILVYYESTSIVVYKWTLWYTRTTIVVLVLVKTGPLSN